MRIGQPERRKLKPIKATDDRMVALVKEKGSFVVGDPGVSPKDAYTDDQIRAMEMFAKGGMDYCESIRHLMEEMEYVDTKIHKMRETGASKKRPMEFLGLREHLSCLTLRLKILKARPGERPYLNDDEEFRDLSYLVPHAPRVDVPVHEVDGPATVN